MVSLLIKSVPTAKQQTKSCRLKTLSSFRRTLYGVTSGYQKLSEYLPIAKNRQNTSVNVSIEAALKYTYNVSETAKSQK
jgi:hypothetical protein